MAFHSLCMNVCLKILGMTPELLFRIEMGMCGIRMYVPCIVLQ